MDIPFKIFEHFNEVQKEEFKNYNKNYTELTDDDKLKILNVIADVNIYQNASVEEKKNLWAEYDLTRRYYCDIDQLHKEQYIYIIKCYEEPTKIPFSDYSYIINCQLKPQLVKNGLVVSDDAKNI